MKKEFIYSLHDLSRIAEQLADQLQSCAVVTLTGPLGAGKTTLVQQLLRAWGVHDEIVSPTFNYVNIYKNQAGKTFFHFDLYRIKSVNDFLESGFDEYLYAPDSIALIEWPQVIEPLLHTNIGELILDYADNGMQRTLTVIKKEERK